MSDQDRDYHAKGNEDATETGEDVEAHVRKDRGAIDEAEGGGDDVEAHVRKDRGANDDEGGDDVEAHVKTR
jgi:hypothetical protein